MDLAEPGIVVGRTIHTLDGIVLLNAGTELTDDLRDKLVRNGITEVYVDDHLSEGIDISETIKDEVLHDVKSQVKLIMSSPSIKVSVDGKKVSELVEKLILSILQSEDILTNLADIRTIDEYTFSHSVNVCVLSLVTGIGMGIRGDNLRDLGVGSMLHDIGKVMIDNDILQKPATLTNLEFNEVKKHTVYGNQILKNSKDISPTACMIALSHHERLDGSGYPNGTKGGEIHLPAKIVAIADVYDALTTNRVYRKKMMPHDVIDYLCSLANKHFDKTVLDAFIRHIAHYPVGTAVVLNSGEKGLVSRFNPYFPNRPVIRVVMDDTGNMLYKYKEVDLAKKLDYRVVAIWEI